MKQDRRRRLDRPLNWGKERALELVSNESQTLRDHLIEIAGPMGISWRALYQEIQRWKTEDEDFRQAYLVAMGSRSNAGSGIYVFGLAEQYLFLQKYLETGKKSLAAEAAGISASHAYNLCRPSHADYDPEFAEQVERIKRERLTLVEDGLTGDMENAREGGDFKTSSNIARFILERQDPENWGRMVEMQHKHSGEVKHSHRFSAEQAQAELARDMQQTFGDKETKEIEAEVVR